MKLISLILFVVAMSITFNASSNLDSNSQQMADMILSGDDKLLKAAAENIKSTKMTDTTILDMLAEVLLIRYADAYPSEVDTLAWVARAIGNSENGRYYNALAEVESKTPFKKLKRHVDYALDDLDEPEGEQYTLGTYKLPAGLFARESNTARDERIMQLIMAGDLRRLKEGARAIIDTNAQNTELTDALAEILMTHYTTASDNKIDTLSWIATALGHSTSGRYVDVLTKVKEDGVHRKLRKYAKRALKKQENKNEVQYQKGMLGKPVGNYNF